MAKSRPPVGPGGSGTEKFVPAHPAKSPAPPATPACSSCGHWHPVPAERPDGVGLGECRHSPPTMPGTLVSGGNLTRFPLTLATTGCGQHRPRSGSAA